MLSKRFKLRAIIEKGIYYLKTDPHVDVIERAGTKRFKKTTFDFLGQPLEIHDSASFRHSYEELFIRNTYQFKAINDAPLILDCGCNMGLSILYFKQLYPKSQILAFEADRSIYETAQKNIQRRGLADVRIYHNAVWDCETVVHFVTEGGLGGRVDHQTNTDNVKGVKTVRLKDYLQQPVDFLKIDIEGAEGRVLKDCRSELGNVQRLFVEYHSRYGDPQTLHESLAILQEAGFRYHIKEAHVASHPFMHQNLNYGMDLQLNVFAYRD